MTKEEMLSAIYDEMADKTHRIGCIYEGIFGERQIYSGINIDVSYKCIGNPVRIGDVLKYIDMNCCFKEPSNDGLRGRDMEALDKMLRSVFYAFVGKQDRPIEEQDDLCIEFVYNLIKK